MARYIITLLLAVCFAGNADGQPKVRGMHRYDGTPGYSHGLMDIFATDDGGYAACGGQWGWWILKIDSSFQTEWSITSDGRQGENLYSIIETDNGGFLAGGVISNSFVAIKTDGDGEVLWNRSYGNGSCWAVMELKNGNYVLIGDDGTVMTNTNGGTIWRSGYGGKAGRETDGGIVIASLGNGAQVTKIDFEGRFLWSSAGEGVNWGRISEISTMISTSDGGFLVGGQAMSGDVTRPVVFKINGQGDWQWSRIIGDQQICWWGWQLARWRNDGCVFVGGAAINQSWSGVIYRLNNDGEIRWNTVVDDGIEDNNDWTDLFGVTFAHDGSILASARSNPGRLFGYAKGLIVEIEPEIIGPTIVDAIPLSTSPVVLPGDSIFFAIHAENQWGDEITYAFFRDEEQIANDSVVTVLFDDLGEFLITGRAYSGGDSDQVVWNVDVAELHIIENSPDTLNLDVRQGGEIDFSIDSVLAVGGNEGVEYLWTRVNLDIEDEDLMGRDSSTTIAFPNDARYQVVGQAYRDDQSDEVVWNVHVRSGILDLGRAEIEVEPGHVGRVPLVIFNDEDTTLNWQSSVRVRGEPGIEPWTRRESLDVTEATGDDRIEGVVFDGESYFCAGANGDDPNMIYRIDREGELLGSFPQPGHSRYGFKDLEWDGELIWGSGDDSVFAVNREEEVVYRWRAPFSPTNNIAFDRESGILWLSGVTTEITAYDQVGNNLGQSLDRHGLRMYGLGWFAEDPDSACLYVVNSPTADLVQINKIKVSSSEMLFVTAIQQDSAASHPFRGGFISRDYDPYQGWVMTTIADIPEGEGGDEIRVMQLQPNTEWLTVRPESGEIAAGERVEVEIIVRTSRWDGAWAFEEGEYEGEIVFTHDGEGGQDILPIYLIVAEPGGVDELGDGFRAPSSFKLLTPYPNPFNASTTIRFSLPAASKVRLTVYDITGRVVRELGTSAEAYPADEQAVVWNGAGLAAGVYLVRLEAGGEVRVVKAVVAK